MHTPSFITVPARPIFAYVAVGLMVINVVALTANDPLYLGSFVSFAFIITIPGLLALGILIKGRLPAPLALALSIALSVLLLMLCGLLINTVLPLFGMMTPLNTPALLAAFDAMTIILALSYATVRRDTPIEPPALNTRSWIIGMLALALPVAACLGAIILNNGGTTWIPIVVLLAIALLVPIVILFSRGKISRIIPPTVLYFSALALLLMNAMRGWFVTGHDILLEYHVFSLTDTADLWSMALYQDPYMACLSLTILPTFLQSLIHVDPAYIFKFFMQLIGALPVVLVYYLAREYVSERMAFLSGFVYITFPTFMVDMPFLNRQGLAFLFFAALIWVALSHARPDGWRRHVLLVALGTGMILSHYSTSYIAMATLIGAYAIARIMRLVVCLPYPRWYARLTDYLPNKSMYRERILLQAPTIIILVGIMYVWTNQITHTSGNFTNSLREVVVSLQDPSLLTGNEGPAKYSLVQGNKQIDKPRFSSLVKQGIAGDAPQDPVDVYPKQTIERYDVSSEPEPRVPISSAGEWVQAHSSIGLASLFDAIKQWYALTTQILLMVGLLVIAFGLGIKKSILRPVPVEYIALCVAGIMVIAMQTILPPSAIDYGILRLFLQNLTFFGLPITVGLLLLTWVVTRNHTMQLALGSAVLGVFFVVLSGALPQILGGGRPLLPLNNIGLYYDAYYTHAQEIDALEWIKHNAKPGVTIQSDRYFSNIKMITFSGIAPLPGLLPETTRRNAYVYLNHLNTTRGSVIEYVQGDIAYYHFPRAFLDEVKDLMYDNGGSAVYR